MRGKNVTVMKATRIGPHVSDRGMNLERIRHAINLRVCICIHYRHVYLVIICMRASVRVHAA